MVPMYMPLCVNAAADGFAEGIAGVDDPGQSQVQHSDRPGVVEHEVARLDVAVDNPQGMGGPEPAGRVNEAVDGLGDRHRAALADDAVEVAPLDVVHDQRNGRRDLLLGVLSGHEVGMLEAAGGLDLATKPHDGIAVARERRRQDLERAHCSQPAMSRLEDDAHPSLPELVEDEIVADQEAAAFLLVDGCCLVGGDLARLDQGAREPQHPFGRVVIVGRDLRSRDQADLNQSRCELVEIGDARRRGRLARGLGSRAGPKTEGRHNGLCIVNGSRWFGASVVELVCGRHAKVSARNRDSPPRPDEADRRLRIGKSEFHYKATGP